MKVLIYDVTIVTIVVMAKGRRSYEEVKEIPTKLAHRQIQVYTLLLSTL